MVALGTLSCLWLMCMTWQHAETWEFQGRRITPIHLFPFQDQRGCNRLHYGLPGPPQLAQFGRNSRATVLRSRRVKRTCGVPPSCMGMDNFSGDKGRTEEKSSGEDLETPVFRVRGLGDLTSQESARMESRESSENQTPTDKRLLKATDRGSTWEAVTQSLGIGPWTYVLLGSSIFILLLNTILGPGWFARVIQNGGGFDARESSSSLSGVYQIMPLDDPSNLLDYP